MLRPPPFLEAVDDQGRWTVGDRKTTVAGEDGDGSGMGRRQQREKIERKIVSFQLKKNKNEVYTRHQNKDSSS